MKLTHEVVLVGNAAIWCVTVLLVAIFVQGTLYFLPVVATLCIAALVSVVLVAKAGSPRKKEWYEGG